MESKDARWWDRNGSEATAKGVTSALAVLEKYWENRKLYLGTAARLYGNLPPTTMFGPTADPAAGFGTMGARLTRNVIQSCIDTIQARVASRIHPMVMWLSTNGTYRARRRAKRLTRFTDGLFREQKTNVLMPRVFKDAEIFGSGYVAVVLENGRIKFERLLESELRWDEIEARYGMPRQLHRVRPVDRDKLLALWPSKSAIINRADAFMARDNGDAQQAPLSPLVQIRESWKLPDGPDAKGRHVVTIPGGVLVDEEWTHDWYPIVKVDYNSRPIGWTGQGLVEILADTQVAINRHLHAISTSLYLMGTFKIALEEGSRVDPNQLTNGFGSIFWYRRTASGGGLPAYLAPPAIQPELFDEVARLEQKAYQLSGVSMTTAGGIKQPGVNAAVAMREMVDIENDRFATVSANYEAAHVELGRIAVELLADSVERGDVDKYTVQDIGSRRKPIVDFEDIDFDRDEFSIQAFPVSSLPHDPAGRMQTVQEWIAAGWLDPKQGRRLLQFPDIQSWESLQDASTEWIEYALDEIIDGNRVIAPDPDEDNLAEALELVAQEILLAKLGGMEDDEPEVMSNLRRYRDKVILLLQTKQAMAMPPQMPAGPMGPPAAAPMGRPPPQPISELMPVAPK